MGRSRLNKQSPYLDRLSLDRRQCHPLAHPPEESAPESDAAPANPTHSTEDAIASTMKTVKEMILGEE